MQKSFSPAEWLPKSEPTAKIISNSTSYYSTQTSNNEDFEIITSRIEAAKADITQGYDNWRDLGFAIVEGLGESGRTIYHRISCLNPEYNTVDCDTQYDKCLRATGHGITRRTFFQKAKEAGIALSTENSPISAKSAILAKSANKQTAEITPISANSHTANIAETAEVAEIPSPLPTFSDLVKDNLPEFLKRIVSISNSPADADILILGTLTVLSACLPHIYGIYDRRTVYPNLFLFVTARASSGKGRLTLCRHLVEPIHIMLRETNEVELISYKQKLAEFNAAGKKKINLDKPEEPPMRLLFIPANSSATAVYQVLNDNNGQGLMFETEGDTLANTFGSDYGNFSDGFRKAFHHETISYIRRKDREYVNIRQPRLSTLLTGTPRQILNLITDAENGLFSRFAFYSLDTKLVWNNVFDNSMDITMDEYFQELGNDFYDLYNILSSGKDLKFSLSEGQEHDFNAMFDTLQQEYVSSNGDEFLASVRRLGLITFRIAMILSALRIMEDGNIEEDLVCLDRDYTTAKTIASVLIRHNEKVFSDLPKSQSATIHAKPTHKRQHYEAYFNALPEGFDRKTYIDLATQMGLPPSTMDRVIRNWVEENKLQSVSHGKYRKV